ncbi:MAG: hypothetical protein JNK63_02075 [Chthonomonas sp.]|nr:hypothetical protein [Chthonomonas sp.]
MAFEELGTDEKLESAIPATADMDTQMIGGCSGFVAAAMITYVLGIWPFFALHPRIHELPTLILSCTMGLIPASVFGAFVGFRWGLATGCGFFGGALTISVFLYLSLQQAALGHTVRELPVPDYPASFMWWIPFAWILISLVIATAFSSIGEHRRGKSGFARR